MKNKPLITIATVTYNAEATLERTLQSVACQDYDRVEHLIVDGRSKDGTLRLVQRYVEQNVGAHSIRLVCEHDNGLYDAMNKAIQLATGDYLAFLNAGDKLKCPSTLSLLADKMDFIRGDHRNPAIVYGQTDVVDAEGRFLHPRHLQAPRRLHWRSFRRGMLVCHQSFYVRTDLARITPYDLRWRLSADFDWCIRLMQMAERRRLPLVDSGLTLTDYLSEGLTTQNHRKSLAERMRIMAHHYGWPTTMGMHLFFVFRSLFKR